MNWVSAREPSTGELIFRLLKVARWPITKLIADNLFTAVSTDTGSFQYPTTRPGTFHTGAELVTARREPRKNRRRSLSELPAFARSIAQARLQQVPPRRPRPIAYLWLKKADFARTGAVSNDSEGLIDHIRAIEPVVIACVFEEIEPELTRISLRSKSDKINVNEIAQQFGGGGHSAAAGARIPGKPLTVQRKVIAAVKKALDNAK